MMMLMIEWPNEILELSNFVLRRETCGFGLGRCRNGRNYDDDDDDDDDDDGDDGDE